MCTHRANHVGCMGLAGADVRLVAYGGADDTQGTNDRVGTDTQVSNTACLFTLVFLTIHKVHVCQN